MNNDMKCRRPRGKELDPFTRSLALRCCFCQQELRPLAIGWCCDCGLCADKELWQRLIRTRKALDVTRHAIGWINQMIDEQVDKQAIKIKCEYALQEITALEQKD